MRPPITVAQAWAVVSEHYGWDAQAVLQSQATTNKKSLSVQAEPVAWMRKDKDMITAQEKRPDYAYTQHYDVPLYTRPAPDHTALLRQALEALRLPCDRWSKQQTLIVNDTIAAIEGALK